MKIAHYLKNLHLTGGTKVLGQHQKFIKSLGHQVYWFAKNIRTDFDFETPVIQINDVEDMAKYDLDILIVNKPKDYFDVKKVPVNHLIYLSQAYEVDHMNIRREKKKKNAHSSFLGKWAMDIKWWTKKRRVHRLYAEDTEKWAVSPYLMEVLKPYGAPLHLVRNSFDNTLYNMEGKKRNSPLRILSVGDYSLSRKNLPMLFEAMAKNKKNFHFTRVSPNPITDDEKNSGLIDEFHTSIPEDQLAGIYRNSDILVSTSTDEGFGLPVIEAMACGALAILSTIGAYKKFAMISEEADENYALFFDPHSPDALAKLLHEVTEDYEKFEKIRQSGIHLTSFYTRERTIDDIKKALDGLNK